MKKDSDMLSYKEVNMHTTLIMHNTGEILGDILILIILGPFVLCLVTVYGIMRLPFMLISFIYLFYKKQMEKRYERRI